MLYKSLHPNYHRFPEIVRRTVCVIGRWAGVDNAWKQYKRKFSKSRTWQPICRIARWDFFRHVGS